MKSDSPFLNKGRTVFFLEICNFANYWLLQAFLELGTEEAAITMVNYYTAVTPQV